MKCPYCTSEIDDKAIVCPVCSRDLMFFIPLLKKSAQTEQRLAEFINKVQEVKLLIVKPGTEREERLSRLFHIIKLLWVYSIQWIALTLITSGSLVIVAFSLLLYSVMAAPYGMWSGFVIRQARVPYFFLVAILLGITDGILRGSYYDLSRLEILIFFVNDILWYYTGCVFGKRLRRWADVKVETNEEYLTMDDLIIAEPEGVGKVSGVNDRRKTIKEYITLFAPLITSIICTIISVALSGRGK